MKKNIRWNTMKILAAGFLGVILIGGVLLSLPACNTRPMNFMDALFTSTSAVCVTGLVTVTPATQFTLLGQMILLILIQVGGLGVIACMTAFFLILRKRITVKERILIQETYNMDSPGGMVKLIHRILKGTFIVEGAGAILYAFQFIPEYGMIKGIWYSVFHSISAFCNAGIDILGSSSFTQYVNNPLINITTMLLIVLGGLGFIVWYDLLAGVQRAWKKENPGRWWFTRLSLHSKVVLTVTVGLILAGALNFFLAEYGNPDTLGNLPIGSKIMASFFQSVTTRTAGFATVPQAALNTESQMISCVFMFIGGSPGGTAGGIKTTTIGLIVICCMAVVKGRDDAECFGRKVAEQNIRMGSAVITLAVIVLFTGTAIVAGIESDVPFIRVLYETCSAIGTVGLTADLTPDLARSSQSVIMIMMYIGRIGPMTLALLFGGRTKQKGLERELPTQRVMVG